LSSRPDADPTRRGLPVSGGRVADNVHRVNPIERVVRRIDGFQQRNRVLAFPFGVMKKFGDDQAGYLAALIAYYGFFSVFPLLLVFVTILGLILGGSSHLAQTIQHSALGQFPVIGDQIRVASLGGSVTALVIGILTSLWAGLGVMQAAQYAMNEIWDIAKKDRPNFWISRLRALLMLVVLGTFVVAATFLSGLTASIGRGLGIRILTLAASFLVNLGLYMIAFRVLTRKNLTWGDVFAGAAFGAVVWTALQVLGTYYIQHQVAGARSTYGAFAVVLGLLVWIYLGAQVTLYAAEINVVRRDHLWPRSLSHPPLTPADRDAFTRYAEQEERLESEDIKVRIDSP